MLSMMHSIWTVVLFVVFIGIVYWAWSARRRDTFDRAARSVLEDDDNTGATSPEPRKEDEERAHG